MARSYAQTGDIRRPALRAMGMRARDPVTLTPAAVFARDFFVRYEELDGRTASNQGGMLGR
jgi:hypothetical protein